MAVGVFLATLDMKPSRLASRFAFLVGWMMAVGKVVDSSLSAVSVGRVVTAAAAFERAVLRLVGAYGESVRVGMRMMRCELP